VNQAHLNYLSSPDWARALETDLLPWIEQVADLGDDLLEIGPGPGLTTDLLRARVASVTAVEIDDDLAPALAERLAGTNVRVIHGDAAATGLEADRFSAATCLSMFHHVPTPDHQDAVFAEIARVLRPGARLFAVDARDIDFLRAVHEDDTFVPLDESTLATRLGAAGFTGVTLDLTDHVMRFTATKPS
jgi:SAM-dependent methyltransferase